MKPPRTLQEKQDEKSRLWRKFVAAKRQEWADLCAQEPRLPIFRKELRRTRTAADTLLYVADSWVRAADQNIRQAALRQINRHADRMARAEGRSILDDPLPPARNVFLASRELLGAR